MSKVFAPGLRVGYFVAAEHVVDRAAREIMLIDRQGNTMTEMAVADLMTSGEVKNISAKPAVYTNPGATLQLQSSGVYLVTGWISLCLPVVWHCG